MILIFSLYLFLFEFTEDCELIVQFDFYSQPLLYTQSDLDEVIRAREVDWKKKYEELESKVCTNKSMNDARQKKSGQSFENKDLERLFVVINYCKVFTFEI